MAIIFDPNESRDRRIKMLLDTATQAMQIQNQKQQLEQTAQQNQIENSIKMQQIQSDMLKNRATETNNYLTAGYTPTSRGSLLQMNPEARRQALASTTKDIYGQRYNAPESFDSRIARLSNDPNTPVGTTVYDKKTGVRVPINQKLTQEQADSVAAIDYITPRYDRITTTMNDSKLFEGNTFEKLAKQITVSKQGDLIVPDGHPLEDMIGAINDIRLTGFALGGKNFTESEQKILFDRLSPVGKSKARYEKDLKSLPDFFKAKIRAMKGGMRGAGSLQEAVTSGKIGDVEWEVIE